MSNAIICKSCQTANPLGSKFCNNCGDRLPPSTQILCPHCGNPNPSKHIYCDHCGKKLTGENLPQEPKPEEQKSGREMFSLPARPPGSTIPIGPNNLPDWQSSFTEEKEDDPTLHSLEEIAPLQKSTDELPTWLVDKLDSSDPVFEPPQEINTDHFLELLNAAEQEENISPDMAQAAAEADLPDWLQAAIPPDDPSGTDFSSSIKSESGKSQTGSKIPDAWLSDLDEDEPPRSGVFETSEFAEKVLGGNDLPDWLEDAQESAEEDIQPISGVFQSEEFAQEVRDALDKELPDWLTSSSGLEPEEIESEPDVFADLLDAPFEPGDDSLTPDWLSDLGPAFTAQFTQEPQADDELAGQDSSAPVDAEPDADVQPATSGLDDPLSGIFAFGGADELFPDWLEEPFPEIDEEDEGFQIPDDEMGSAISAGAELDPDLEGLFNLEEEIEPDASFEASPDWLNELTALGPDAFSAELGLLEEPPAKGESAPLAPPTFSDDESRDAFSAEFTGLFGEEVAEDNEEGTSADAGVFGKDVDLGEAEKGEVPEWLTQLGIPRTDSESADYESEDAVTGEQLFSADLPDWVTEMQPGTKTPDSLTSLAAGALREEEFSELPDELADLEDEALPDWLEDAHVVVGVEGKTAVSPGQEIISDIPDWLQIKPGEKVEDLLGLGVQDITGELGALLEALPRTQDPAAELVKAELPDWIKALRPKELSTEQPELAPPLPVQETGPLTGIRGVVEIQPVMAMPHQAPIAVPNFTVTSTQQEQAALLRQIQAGLQEQSRTISVESFAGLSPAMRLLLSLLLLAAIGLGLFGPNWQREPAIPAGVANAVNAIETAAGKNVLLAFEYTPAMAAELNPQAELLLAHLAEQGSSVITISQYAAGLALARGQTETYAAATLGFIPGEAIGLREVGACLHAGQGCQSLAGRELSAAQRAQLGDVALIIVLTGERTSLVNWIEQIGAAHQVPVVAGVTQALAPVAAPYAATGQLQGVIGGLVDTAVYAQLTDLSIPDTAPQRNAQHLAQLLAALLFIIGALISLWIGREKQA